MKLYSAGPSPFARKARIAVIELGLQAEIEIIEVIGTPLDSGSFPISQNPLGKIPCLTRKDGPAIYDSRVITRFMNDHANGRLYPDAPRLWETLTLEATGDGIMEAGISMVYERRCRLEKNVSEEWIEAQWTKISRSLDAVQERWVSHLAAPMDMAQISIAVALEYLDFRMPERDWRKSRKALSDWHKEFGKRKAMKATKPE